ncbi:hypothetical protein [Blautia producta]|uniref:hypothetical protein n=1 Tax=Blautia producta TaxID=33035 RepID=UPI003984349F
MDYQRPGKSAEKLSKLWRKHNKKELKLKKLYGNLYVQTQEELGKGKYPLPGSSFLFV